MNKLLFGFYIVKKGVLIEASFDSRLNFIDNFRLLETMYPINIDELFIYDKNHDKFLSKNEPLNRFNFNRYTLLYLF